MKKKILVTSALPYVNNVPLSAALMSTAQQQRQKHLKKGFEGMKAQVFSCGECGKKIGITKKDKGGADNEDSDEV